MAAPGGERGITNVFQNPSERDRYLPAMTDSSRFALSGGRLATLKTEAPLLAAFAHNFYVTTAGGENTLNTHFVPFTTALQADLDRQLQAAQTIISPDKRASFEERVRHDFATHFLVPLLGGVMENLVTSDQGGDPFVVITMYRDFVLDHIQAGRPESNLVDMQSYSHDANAYPSAIAFLGWLHGFLAYNQISLDPNALVNDTHTVQQAFGELLPKLATFMSQISAHQRDLLTQEAVQALHLDNLNGYVLGIQDIQSILAALNTELDHLWTQQRSQASTVLMMNQVPAEQAQFEAQRLAEFTGIQPLFQLGTRDVDEQTRRAIQQWGEQQDQR